MVISSHKPPLLMTKVQTPPLRTSVIRRPRLTAQLNTGLAGKLTLLSAPPGFGKTTLLGEWRAVLPEGWAMAWVALGAEDNDTTRFWSYVIAALQRVHPGVGDDLLARLYSPQPLPMETLLTGLLNVLAFLPVSTVLVLDDYHTIRTPAIHASIDQLLAYLPPTLHVTLAGRVQPPVALANLRARGQLTELRSEDLRCTPEEVAQLLNTALALGLESEDVAMLAARTDGWFAGLHLAALSLRDRDDPASFVHAFNGSHRYLIDYLGEEVLERQPATLQEFLLRTAILGELSGPLCDALWRDGDGVAQEHDTDSRPPAEAILHALEKSNIFITPLDDERCWYRYHPLFAEFLQHRLRQRSPALERDLHRRACAWHRAQGMVREAVDHALAIEDTAMAADLVAAEAENLLRRGQVGVVLSWFDALPESLLQTSPILSLLRIWMWLLNLELDRAARQLEMAAQKLTAHEADPAQWGRWHAVAAYVVRVHGADFAASEQHSQKALNLLPESDTLWRSMVRMNLGLIPLLRGDIPSAALVFEALVTDAPPDDDLYSHILGLTFLGRCQVELGMLHRAEMTQRRALEVAVQHGASHWPTLGYVHLGLGMIERERRQYAEAARCAERAVAAGQLADNLELRLNALILLAIVQSDIGDFASAADALAQLAEKQDSLGPSFRSLCDALTAASALKHGELATVRRWVETCGLTPEPLLDVLAPGMTFSSVEILYFTLARALLSLGRPHETHQIAVVLRGAAEAGSRRTGVVRALALEAAALHLQGRRDAALTTLSHLLQVGEPEGYMHSLVEIGAPLAALLCVHSERVPASDYVQRLLAAFGDAHLAELPPTPIPEPRPEPKPDSLLEPLTERELEILRLLRSELRVPEIADHLYVAPSTVRSHVKRLYAKLGVHNRGEAVARAHALHLL